MATLAEIRKKLAALEENKNRNSRSNSGTSLVYPFWNIAENEPVQIRFLPDADPDNTFFWREIQMINLEFPGVKGGDEHKPVYMKVPCVEMWGDACPVHAELRPMFKDTSLEETAKKYWKKRSYVFQGFVIDNPITDDAENAPENPIRRFNLGRQLYNIIKSSILDPEMEMEPFDYVNGCNFRIVRTKKGTYNDYSTSNWSRKESALDSDQLGAIEEHGLFNLSDWMPKKPSAEQLNAIYEMFETSLEGGLYDPDKWAAYYRPWGLEYDGAGKKEETTTETTTTEAKTSENVERVANLSVTKEEPVAEEVAESPNANAGTSSDTAQDILAKIRARNS